MASYDHYEAYEWLGAFWTPDKAIQFPGKLTYSPENGIELEFLYSMTGLEVKKTNYIFGILANGQPCTLYGSFNPDRFGFHSGKVSIYKGKIRFRAAIFGENSSPEERYDGIWLDFTNFQEFCHPQGLKDYAKFSSKPIQQFTTNEITISIVNNGKFKLLGNNNFSNLFHCENEIIVQEIESFFQNLQVKYPQDIVRARSDIGWAFHIQSKKALTIEEFITSQIESAENLLSLLIYSPIRRKEIFIIKKIDISSGKFESLSLPLLTSLFDIDNFKIDVLKRELTHLNLPISVRNSNFVEIFAKWKEIEEGAQLFTGIISNRFGKSHQHQLYAEIVLMLTQIEAISTSLGAEGKEKYTLALNKYASERVIDILKSYFSVADDEKLGKSLTNLRAEVAHVGKPPVLLKSLSAISLIGITRALEIAIASHIYTKLGISTHQISQFQMRQFQLLPPPNINATQNKI